MTLTKSGRHKWIIGGRVIYTSASSVAMIRDIGKRFAPALKRLAKS